MAKNDVWKLAQPVLLFGFGILLTCLALPTTSTSSTNDEIWPNMEGATDHSTCPFCYEMDCMCHEDPERIGALGQAVTDGLASPADADRIYRGQTV